MNNLIRLILLITFSWISFLILSYFILIVIVPFPILSNSFLDRFLVGIIKVVLSAILFLLWLLLLLVLRNYIAIKSIFK